MICAVCRRVYPVVEGIPDLRLFDAARCGYAGGAAETRAVAELSRFAATHDADQLLAFWVSSFTSVDARLAPLAESYLAFRREDADKAANLVAHVASLLPAEELAVGLDIGCGSGGGVRGLARRCRHVVAVDIQLPELICARKAAEELGLGERCLFLAANAEHLPLRPASVNLICALDVYEHVADRRRFVRDGGRVVAPGGLFYFETQSRFKWIEGHVKLPAVGYLPHFLQRLYVRLARGVDYPIYLPSLWGLRRLVRREAAGRQWWMEIVPYVSARPGPLTWRGRLVRRWPWLVALVNAIYAPFSSFNVYLRGD